MDETKKMSELIEIMPDAKTMDHVRIPTAATCAYCRGQQGVYVKKDERTTIIQPGPAVCYGLQMAGWMRGMEHAMRFNQTKLPPPEYTPCGCQEVYESLMIMPEFAKSMGIEVDGGWQVNERGNCYTSYSRVVIFNEQHPKEVLNAMKIMMQNGDEPWGKCPGWTPVSCSKETKTETGWQYEFHTTYDSGG